MTITEMEARKFLLIQYSSDRNGSAISGLSLANGLREHGWETFVAFGYTGPIEDEYRVNGHQTCVVGHKSWLRRSNPLRFIKDLIVEWRKATAFEALMMQVKPEVVYINTSVSLAAVVAAKRQKIKTVWHLRELFSNSGGEMVAPTIGKPYIRVLFKSLSDRLIVNSQAVAENMLGASLAREAVVVPNAVSRDCFDDNESKADARKGLGLPLNATIIGVPGTLRPMKGHSFFFQAAARLADKYPGAVFVITGDGEANFVKQLKDEVSLLGINERVIFTGSLHSLTSFYKACDIVCIPSKAEPFGRVVIEAFAAGVPVIATSVGGIPEIIDAEVNGLLVSYGDVKALADNIELLLTDEGLRNRLVVDARHKAEREYHEEIYKTRIVGLVESLVSDSAH